MEVDDKGAVGQMISASIPCTCGELFQGTLQGEPCLVSCPIDIYSSAFQQSGQTNPCPVGRKVRQALSLIPNNPGDPESIRVTTPLPVGRGFGTSTADIGAALYADFAYYGVDLSAEKAAQIAVSVEPTDSTLFTGLALFDHRFGKFYQDLGAAPAAKILIADPGGFVDSEQFNMPDRSAALSRLAGAHAAAFALLQDGIKRADIESIGRAASLSAELHQTILFNPFLEKALQIGSQIGAAGVCRAHSGTILGFLLQVERDDEADLIHYCQERLPAPMRWISTRMVGGGARISASTKNRREEPSF